MTIQKKHELERIYAEHYDGEICFFGGGAFAKHVLSFFQEENLPQPVAIIDNDVKKQGTSMLSVPVMSLEDGMKQFKNPIFVITSKDFCEEIFETLIQTIDESKVFFSYDFVGIKHNKTTKKFASIETLDTLWKESVKARCISHDKKLADLLFLNLHYTNKCFYVMDGKKYLGTIDLKECVNWEQSMISQNLTLKDLLAKFTINKKLQLEQKETYFNLAQLYMLYSVFSNTTGDELPVVSQSTGELLAILDKTTCYAYLGQENYEKTVCELSWAKAASRQDLNLNKYRKNINSQNGEDGVISHIFDVIGTKSSYAVEFGGWDGIFLSNIRNLILERNFSGLFIEGVPERAEEGKKNYEHLDRVEMVNAFVGFEGENTLDAILNRAGAPKEIDLISIDIDGYDYHVWDAFQEYRPRVIVIEHNSFIPQDVLFVNPRKNDVFKGNSAYALVSLGISKGYSLVAVIGCNCIFVLNEEFSKFPVFDNSLEALFLEASSTVNRSMQCYDKSLYSVSMHKNYVWVKNVPFEGKEFRFIPDT